ncbi:hypothetical protein I4U23_019867 [Adineta vaga]|nr:hypothetical protein I4U23_019867 [Adineta vaga]
MSQNHLLDTTIKRTAIKPDGCLGALYDIYRDQINNSPKMSITGKQVGRSTVLQCVEDELRLTSLLQPTVRSGIAAVLSHPRAFDQYTRFLHYSWLPSKDKSVHTIDRILEKVRDVLSRQQTNTLTMNDDEIDLLDKSLSIAVSLPDKLVLHLEETIVHIRNSLKHIETLCKHDSFELAQAQRQCANLKKQLNIQLQLFFKLVVVAREGSEKHLEEIKKALKDSKIKSLWINVDSLSDYISTFHATRQPSTSFLKEQVYYPNMHSNKQTPPTQLATSIAKEKSDRHQNKNTKNETLSIHNISQSTSKQSSARLPSKVINPHEISTEQQPSSPEPVIHHEHTLEEQNASPTDAAQTFPIPTTSINEIMTILLVGESGVGKSTFINALANYLTFDSFEEAESSEPVVLMPVSFVMTVGDNFEEHIVKFGEVDSYNNEKFDHPGQSVTQHCKSYLFDLKHDHGKQLRIIDTPGFGDTRGLDQDEQNMEHILQYINNLTHINAICFLLKPNASRLHIILRTCFSQLFSFLHPDARENLIFCFTNARSTFYSPGDTAPLLKTMLKSLSITNLPFTKTNTFCFDNEAFRFLVSLQNDISFDEESKCEYKTSWSKSVKESNRLIEYINKDLTVYDMKKKWPSTKQAQFEILYMVRPILETMRNILRNLILITMKRSDKFIELISKSLHRRITRCLSCKSVPISVAHFWIIPDNPHDIQTNRLVCQCSIKQHVSLDYTIEYRCQHPTVHNQKAFSNDVSYNLCAASAKFAIFLESTDYCTKGDPFLNGLMEIIAEETDICNIHNQKENHFNSQLVEELIKLKEQYQQELNKIKSNSKTIDIKAVYEIIEVIGQYPMVKEQMAAVKHTHQMMMKKYEHEVQMI